MLQLKGTRFFLNVIACFCINSTLLQQSLSTNGFFIVPNSYLAKPTKITTLRRYITKSSLFSSSSSSETEGTSPKDDQQQDQDETGDKLRAATGIRPSLHPTTINAIAEALKCRAQNDPELPLKTSDTVQPLQVALSAGKIASKAIAYRQQTSEKDGMTLSQEEQQTIAGRVLGVIMRFDELESLLYDVVSNVSWVAKYNEWSTFGTIKDENNNDKQQQLQEQIKNDPLLSMSRAECLLALFIDRVEIPQLSKVNQTVPDESKIDFLDSDHLDVLIGSKEK